MAMVVLSCASALAASSAITSVANIRLSFMTHLRGEAVGAHRIAERDGLQEWRVIPGRDQQITRAAVMAALATAGELRHCRFRRCGRAREPMAIPRRVSCTATRGN